MSSLARRYAVAAVEAAEEKDGSKGVEQLSSGLTGFHQTWQQSSDLRELIANPRLRDARPDVLADIGKKLGLSETTAALVRLLSDNGRMDILGELKEEVDALADERVGRTRARVTSAIPLTPEQRDRVTDALRQRCGQEVLLEVRVDPTILGGLVCELSDITLDSSLKRQLEIFRERLQTDVR